MKSKNLSRHGSPTNGKSRSPSVFTSSTLIVRMDAAMAFVGLRFISSILMVSNGMMNGFGWCFCSAVKVGCNGALQVTHFGALVSVGAPRPSSPGCARARGLPGERKVSRRFDQGGSNSGPRRQRPERSTGTNANVLPDGAPPEPNVPRFETPLMRSRQMLLGLYWISTDMILTPTVAGGNDLFAVGVSAIFGSLLGVAERRM